jgi:PleD family two-component response regulator
MKRTTLTLAGVAIAGQTGKPLKGRILVADDDLVVVETLFSILKGAGYAVTVAQDAMQALMRAVKDAPTRLSWTSECRAAAVSTCSSA